MTGPAWRLRASILALFALFSACFPAASLGRDLTLRTVMDLVVARNLTLRAERFSIDASQDAVIIESGRFDPTFRLELSQSGSFQQSPSLLTPAETQDLKSTVSLGGQTVSGFGYQLQWQSERLDSDLEFNLVNPSWDSELSLTISHPLLRGFGEDAQESGLNISLNNLEISRHRYDETVLNTVTDSIRAYWELFFARADRDVAQRSLELARNLLEEVRGRINAGALASIEIYKTEAEVAIRMENLARAEKTVADREDILRSLMNQDEWEEEIVPVDTPPPASNPVPLDLAIQAALTNRQDYRMALLQRDNHEILRNYYTDQKQPRLDMFASLGFNGVDEDRGESQGTALSMSNQSWTVGMTFELPLGNRAAGGEYLRSVHEAEIAWINLESVRQGIIVEVREAWRNLIMATESIDSSTKTRVAAEKSLQAEEEKFRVGKATLNDVLSFQEGYAKALSAEIRARADYAIALADMERAKGLLAEWLEH